MTPSTFFESVKLYGRIMLVLEEHDIYFYTCIAYMLWVGYIGCLQYVIYIIYSETYLLAVIDLTGPYLSVYLFPSKHYAISVIVN
jgi:hypothetical protein